MQDNLKTKKQLIAELEKLRKGCFELEKTIMQHKEAEEKYRDIFEYCMEGIYQTTLEGRFINVNTTAARLLGYDSSEDLINSVTDIGTQVYAFPEDRDKAMELLKKDGSFENFEMRCRKKDGSIVWGLLSSRLVLDDGGNILYIEGTSQDITERKHMEELIRRNEKMFRAIADYGYDWESWVGPDGKPLWINSGVSRVTGYSPEECMAMDDFPMPLIYEPDKERMIQFFRDAVQGSDGDDIEFRVRRKDGSLRWAAVSWQAIYDDKGVSLGHRSSIRDITKRKQMEEALRESENRFRRFAENAQDIIYRMSLPDGRYEYVSPSVFQISGYAPEEHYTGTISIKNIIHPDSAEYIEEQWKKLQLGKTPPPFYEFKIIHRNGSERWMHQRNVPVFDEAGSLVALEGIATDITSLKTSQEELKRHRDRLEELVQERTSELEIKSKSVEELNVALKVLLHQVQEDKENLEQRLVANVQKLVLPYLEKIRKSRTDDEQIAYIGIIETNLNEIISPFLHAIQHLNLTPREIQIANFVKEGKTTKEIAAMLGLAANAIDSYRNSIRIKLGLNKKKVNLQSYLQTLK